MTTGKFQKDNKQRLKEILDELVSVNPNVLNAIVVSDDGFNLGSGIPHQSDDDTALISSDLMDAGEDFGTRLEQGRLKRIILEGEQRTTVVMNAGKRTILVVLLPADEKLGVLTHSMRQAAGQIASIFG